jgi:hypothetical protein
MFLELGRIPVEAIEWGPKTPLEGSVLRIKRQDLIEKARADDGRITSMKVEIVGPGESTPFLDPGVRRGDEGGKVILLNSTVWDRDRSHGVKHRKRTERLAFALTVGGIPVSRRENENICKGLEFLRKKRSGASYRSLLRSSPRSWHQF